MSDSLVCEKVLHERERVRAFSEGVRLGSQRGLGPSLRPNGSILGHTGRPIKNIISVGIGGSYLGPDFISEVFLQHKAFLFVCLL